MKLNWPDRLTFVSKAHPAGIEIQSRAIAGYAAQIADTLRAEGVKPGDRIALWLTDGVDKVAAIWGCWLAEAAFCVLPSFAGNTKSDRAQARIEGVFNVLQPKLLLQGTDNRLPTHALGSVKSYELTGLPEAMPPITTPVSPAPDDLAFIQFTSGSTGGAKGAEVRFSQLESNLTALERRVGLTSADHMVSWAPLYHDMGLMAVLLALRTGARLTLIETDHFVRRPTAWLETISRKGGTVTTAPPTALKLLTRRRAPDVDLSSLRYAWIGGEAVFPSVVKAFEATYAEAGLAKGVIQPTYGMAETVVGISCGIPGAPWRERQGVISCGPILEDMEVAIQTEDGTALPDGTEGRVMTRGPSVIDGYFGLPRFEGDWFETGDRGFLEDGLLFITGRIKDVLKRGAESYPATLVETIAEDALDLRTGRVAAFAHFNADLGKEEIVLLVESRKWEEADIRTVAAAILSELGLQVDVIRPAKGGRLPRTSSGKLMRQTAAQQYREGEL